MEGLAANTSRSLGLELKYLGEGKVAVAWKHAGSSVSKDVDNIHSDPEFDEKKKKIRQQKAQLAKAEKLKHVVGQNVILAARIAARIKRRKAETFSFLDSCTTTASKLYHSMVICLTLTSLGLNIWQSIEEYKDNVALFYVAFILEIILLGIFGTEQALRLWSCSVHGHEYEGTIGKVRFLLTPHVIIELLVILSSVGLVIAAQLNLSPYEKRMLHLLQLLRLMRFDRQRGAFSMFKKVVMKHRRELLTCWYLSFIVVMFLAFTVYCLENNPGEKTLDNLFNGFYWGVVSMAAIGYGDISPKSGGSKILVVIFGLVGTAFLAMPAGIMGSGFALQVAEKAKEKYKSRKRKPAALLIQTAWRRYAGAQDYYQTWIIHSVVRAKREARRLSRITGRNVTLSNHVQPYTAPSDKQPSKSPEPSKENVADILELEPKEKLALMFCRRLKFNAALRKFKEARRPYDERDILERFFTGQIEMFAKLRQLQTRVDKLNTNIERDNKTDEDFNNRILLLEGEVNILKGQIGGNSLMLKEILKRVAPKG